jgi:plasmid rolling circle replication initiator protein Rep
MNYYNTTNEKGDNLKENTIKAISQDNVILKYFKDNKGVKLSPSMVLNRTNLKCPITSIRRSMSNLTSEGYLIKTDEKVTGIYGRPEYLWKYYKNDLNKDNQLEMF